MATYTLTNNKNMYCSAAKRPPWGPPKEVSSSVNEAFDVIVRSATGHEEREESQTEEEDNDTGREEAHKLDDSDSSSS